MRSRVALPETFPCLKDIPGRLALVDNSLQHIAMNVVESQELFRARFLGVGSTNSLGMTPWRPAQSGHWTQLHGAKLVEADHMAVRRRFGIESQNTVFFTSKSGSGESFQVFVRWRLTPCLFKRRRIHSSV